jgi:2-polyprenyl-3-methyl-5-hydroxy-6-metoxy-1,4-benzoquinol methylase
MHNKNLDKLTELQIERGETQKGVNAKVLENILTLYPNKSKLKALDLPCGSGLFLNYLKKLYSAAELKGADIRDQVSSDSFDYVKMDLSKDFSIPTTEKFDLITSISGVMMFGNTSNFISNCAERLTGKGVFIVTNDNSATIADKFFFMFLGRLRLFRPVYENTETLTQNVPVQELFRLLHINGLEIESIEYTSTYSKDFLFLPFALIVYPIQKLYLLRYKSLLPKNLVTKMFPFKHLFGRHYIITARKKE